jgi:hypothetical protein
MSETLGEAYPKEQTRCRELLALYKEIGPAGAFGRAAIEAVLKRADEAAIRGDLAAMIAAYSEMKECE